MNFLGLFKKKKVPSKKQELKNLALKKLTKLKLKRFSPKKTEEFIRVFRIYMQKKFNFKDQATHQNLLKNIQQKRIKKNLKKKIEEISLRIDQNEYQGMLISGQELNIIIEELKKLIEEIN
ncbi:hypothetical protein HN832_00560 [archaeon]|mgnify:FL=1|jgi:hypothetical protein|nr:hypothetical protein [archaeon]MBT4373887.1 hypothetical protein [archaeon]MBT4532409.1 hypothetical protein [archaeon]MBT7001790.1 hypothetical protein [archaeon]MBT7281885.1 hypothetical protein [archaeon]